MAPSIVRAKKSIIWITQLGEVTCMNVGIDKKLACLLCSKPILSIIYENFYFHHELVIYENFFFHHELLVILLFCLS